MHVVVVGGTRFIGPAIVEALLAAQHRVTLVHRGAHPCDLEGVEEHLADRTDSRALRAAFDALQPDAVIDTRAMTEADARTLVHAVPDVPLVVLSSQDVYAQFGALNGLPAPVLLDRVGEDAPKTLPFPFRGMGAHAPDYDKKCVEAVLADAVGRGAVRTVVVLRLAAVYGRRDPKRRFGFVVDALDAGTTVLPTAQESLRWSHVHVDDVARAVLLAVTDPERGLAVYNVSESDPPTMQQWAADLASHMGRPLTFEPTETPEERFGMLGPFPNHMVADTRRIREKLGYVERMTASERLADTVGHARRTRFTSRPRLILVEGLPGAGKSTTAGWLAQELVRTGRTVASFHEGAADAPVGLPWTYDDAVRTVERTAAGDYPFERWSTVPLEGADHTVLDARFLQHLSLFAMLENAPESTRLELPQRALEHAGERPFLLLLDTPNPDAHLRDILAQRRLSHPAWFAFVVPFFAARPYCRDRGWQGEEAFVGALTDFQAWSRANRHHLALDLHVVPDPAADWGATRAELGQVLRLQEPGEG